MAKEKVNEVLQNGELQAMKNDIFSLIEEGKSASEIKEALKLTAPEEEIAKFMIVEKIKSYLINYNISLGEIADLMEIELNRVEAIAIPFDEEAERLKAQRRTSKQIAEALSVTEEDIKQYFKNSKEKKISDMIISYHCGGYPNVEIAEELKLDEEKIAEVVDAFKRKVLAYTSKGKTIEEISSILDFSSSCILFVLRNEKERYKNQKAIAQQTFTKLNKAGLKDRLQRLSILRDSLMKEINSRGIRNLPTEKLIALYLKTEDAIRIEMKAAPQVVTFEDTFENMELSL